ncbi:B12-binding domain-containing radical SAM protein [Thermanaeromonas sp. C210]|uniref:B12-binding domain-containing radical SAM protein n=1 Tax=Thermanaeromonas sp. C210 TaxID=2731925 RepID=UPI00155BFC54|nr:radical SAM protein [Thermanaeromonas sp. C210]GFN24088.1 B12-binding domain-containing radical SAM protein [Thermanaeromonas sp. C210]
MKIALVAPAWHDPLWESEQEKAIFPPLNLITLAALTPAEHEVVVLDESLTSIDFDEKYDLVGISAMTALAPRAYEIADAFRRRGVPVVLGGMHPSALPEEAKAHADAVVIGEAEGQWPRVLEDLKSGNLKPFYRHTEVPPLENMAVPRRDLLCRSRYLVPDTVQTTRGCPFACSFCTVSQFFGHKFRFRPVEEVLREVQALEGEVIAFVDDNIIGNPVYAKRLFQALAPLKIKWFSQGSLNIARDEELLRLAAASGCIGLFIGFESLSPSNLKAVGKAVNRVEEYRAAIKKIHDFGIAIEGAFIFGFDDDDEGIFERTVKFAQENRLEAAQFGILTPFPGTPLRAQLEKEGRIINSDWREYTINKVVFEPKRMSPRTLQEGFNWAWQEFYSLGSISRRLGLVKKHASILWALNLNIRKRFNHFAERLRTAGLSFPSPSPLKQ